jgi:peptidoglycan hydrolase CwlO-like protein
LQDKQAEVLDRMDKDLRSRNYLVDKLMKESDKRDGDVKECQQKIKDLENKS